MPSIGRPAKNPTDFLSFRHQETVLAGLNLLLLALLFLAQLFWPRYLGSPHLPVLVILSLGMAANFAELLWVRLVEDLGEAQRRTADLDSTMSSTCRSPLA